MASQGNSRSDDNTVLLVLIPFFGGLMAVLWFAASPFIGFIYKLVRTVESLGIWAVIPGGWGRYFWSVRNGSRYSFESIFFSSVPFNIISALMIAALGWVAYRRVTTQHIDSHIKSDPPIGYKDLMKKQAPLFPSNEFFLLFPMEEYPIDRGPARYPLTAIEFLASCNAIEGIYADVDAAKPETTGWKIDTQAVTRQLVSVFGPSNPFLDTDFSIASASREEIREKVDALPWHVVSLIYVCLLRIYALSVHVKDDEAFAQSYWTADEHLKSVWREINKIKKDNMDFITLGFIDADDEQLKRAVAAERDQSKTLLTLAEALDAPVNVTVGDATISQKRGDTLKTTVIAREGITALLSAHLTVPETTKSVVAPKKNKKGKPEPISLLNEYPDSERAELAAKAVAFKDLTDVQKAQVKIKRKLQIDCVRNQLHTLITRNGYVFGLTSTLLTEARKSGVLPPALFRWMRFYDYPMWSYLRVVGMNTPTAEVAGMFDHAQVEEKAGEPFFKPFITTSPEGIRREASKYITEKVRSQYRSISRQQLAKNATRNAAASIRKLVDQVKSKSTSDPEASVRELAAATRRRNDSNGDFVDVPLAQAHDPIETN